MSEKVKVNVPTGKKVGIIVNTVAHDVLTSGSDVVQAFTYYGHREKLRLIGKEDLLEPLQKNALKIAKDAAKEQQKWAIFWVYSEVTSNSRDFDKENIIVC